MTADKVSAKIKDGTF